MEVALRLHDADMIWGDCLQYCMDHAQILQLQKALKDISVPVGCKWHSWKQVCETILEIFDSALQKHQRHNAVLHCKQKESESLKDFTMQFRTALHNANIHMEDNPIMLDMFLDHMLPNARHAAVSLSCS